MLRALIGLQDESAYDVPDMPSGSFTRTDVVRGEKNDDHDKCYEEGEN
jgi:hypothetical protein